MKKYLLTGALITITATTLYATTAGSTVVDKMKAAAHSFTLATSLNPTDTGLTSDPVKGKKTGDILTAGEYNRILELLSEGSSGGGAGWENVPLSDTANFDVSCTYRIKFASSGRQPYVGGSPYYNTIAVSPTQLVWWLGTFSPEETYHISATSKNVLRMNGAVYSSYGNITTMEKFCGGGGPSTFSGGGSGGSGWEDVSLTDTADFDKACEYRYQMLNPADNPYMGNDPFKYINAVDNNRLTWISFGEYHHINSDSRTVYRINGLPIAAFTINKLQKRCGGGGASTNGAPAFYYCTNAQSLDASNAPCNGASLNNGSGNGRYRAISASFSGAGAISTNPELSFFSSKWKCSQAGVGHFDCTDGSVLVADTQASGSGSAATNTGPGSACGADGYGMVMYQSTDYSPRKKQCCYIGNGGAISGGYHDGAVRHLSCSDL